MAKFNTPTTARPPVTGLGTTSAVPDTVTHEGAPAYTRDTKMELFLLAVVNFVGENTFYESAAERDARFAALVREVAVADVAWLTRFVSWLRLGAHMRSAPLVAAAEAVHARLAAGLHGGNRALIAAPLQRADEPGEMLAYWFGHFGRNLPMPVKRGVADAALRLYREYQLLKYDTDTRAIRFADVLALTHAPSRRGGTQQVALAQFAIDRRYGPAEPHDSLKLIRANAHLRELAEDRPEALLDTERLRAAGMTWENVLSLLGATVEKKKLWESLIPVMGLGALVKNLRNFDQAGVCDEAAKHVLNRLADPEQIARSRMLPFQWVTAFKEAPSLRWGHALDKALRFSLGGLPALSGRTLILVDTSSSMTNVSFSSRSKVVPLDAAATFGVALAARGDADLWGWADRQFRHDVPAGASMLGEIARFRGRSGEVGHGTLMAEAVRETYRGHDRVVIISDMQTMTGGVMAAVPSHVPMYGFNLGGYKPTPFGPERNRVELGGLTDATFRMIPLLEAGRAAAWPF